MNIQLKFIGGAGTVTGSKTVLEFNGYTILIDCGLFQGIKQLRSLNWEQLPIEESRIDTVILTHAHLDHCGYLPLLAKHGFKGAIHCTRPTKDLTELVLKDSGKVQEEEAERANRYGYTKHKPAKPLYSVEDVKAVLPNFVGHSYNEWVNVNTDFKFRLLNSGHILGSAFVELKCGEKTLLFSGDMGRTHPLLLHPPEKVASCDYLIVESTYGGREHEHEPLKETLKRIVNKTIDNGGILLIPAFAIERTQEVIYLLSQLRKEKAIGEKIPIYLDSPMGINATEILLAYSDWTKLSEKTCREMSNTVKLIQNAEESKSIVRDNSPKIVLAGSGMIEGGRILHYLNKYIGDSKCTLLLVGYQAEGTRGRALLEQASEIKIFGEYRHIKAKILSINGLSAHADQSDIMEWLSNITSPPKTVFINHGEPHQSDSLRAKIESKLGWNCEIPMLNAEYTLES